MTIFNVGVRVAVFGIALLLGTTAVAASRFVFNTIANVLKPAAISKPAAFIVEPEPFSVLDEKYFPSDESSEPEFEPHGDYTLNIEKVPKAFADFRFIGITTHEYTQTNGKYISIPVVPNGRLLTKKEFSFKKIAIGNREISFETESVDGISYQFVGQFSKSQEVINCEGCEYPPDLTGILKKVKNGNVVAELTAKFYISGC